VWCPEASAVLTGDVSAKAKRMDWVRPREWKWICVVAVGQWPGASDGFCRLASSTVISELAISRSSSTRTPARPTGLAA
jgi:hypothetical protein